MLLNLSTIYKTRESDSYRKALSNMFLLITSRITSIEGKLASEQGESGVKVRGERAVTK